MSLESTQSDTRVCRPHNHGRIATSHYELTSIRANHHGGDDSFMHELVEALLILEPLRHEWYISEIEENASEFKV
jgi:hypothetical protein